MRSNTKLTKEQKAILKDMKREYPHVQFASDGQKLVCAFYPVGDNIRFAFAIKSDNEQKFRRKVGEMVAMEKVLPGFNDNYAILPDWRFWDMLQNASMDTY